MSNLSIAFTYFLSAKIVFFYTRILAGLYSGVINIWSHDSVLECKLENENNSGIRSLKNLSINQECSDFVAAGHENGELEVIRLSSSNPNEDNHPKLDYNCKRCAKIVPHHLSIADVVQLPNTNILLTASYDETCSLISFEADIPGDEYSLVFSEKIFILCW